MKTLLLALFAVATMSLAGCAGDTHLRHDDQSRSSGNPGATYGSN